MACSITINTVVSNSGTITVTGTVSGCTSLTINLTIKCAAGTFTGTGNQLPGSTFWQGSVVTGCACGTPITVTAVCSSDPTCTVTYTSNSLCCCPSLSAVANTGLCDSNGNRLVTLVTTGTIQTGCPVSVQWDFGDGNFGPIVTLGPSSLPYAETHPYVPGIYSASLNIISPQGCNNPIATANVQATPACPPCNTNPILAFICSLLQPLFIFFGGVAVGLYSMILNPPTTCLANPNISGAALASLIIALGLLVIIYFACRHCICAFLIKLLAQAFLAGGLSVIMFLIPINCANFNSIFIYVVIIFLIGIMGIGLLYVWYNAYRNICPLKICDFWNAVMIAALIGGVVIFTVFVIIVSQIPAGVNPLGLLLAVLVAIGIFNLAASQIQINTNAGNC